MAAERARARFFGTTADLGLRVSAPDPGTLFTAAADALFSRMGDRRTVRPSTERIVDLASENREALLVGWLNEIIYLRDAEGFMGRKASASVSPDGRRVTARILGEAFDPSRHRAGTVFKAATWHRLSVTRVGGEWRATVVFDV